MDENVNFGDSVQLSCHVSKGDKPLDIVWDFHGKEALAELNIVTTRMGDRTSFLTISSITGDHNGNYTCRASNAAGTTSYTTLVHVNGTLLVHLIFFGFLGFRFAFPTFCFLGYSLCSFKILKFLKIFPSFVSLPAFPF